MIKNVKRIIIGVCLAIIFISIFSLIKFDYNKNGNKSIKDNVVENSKIISDSRLDSNTDIPGNKSDKEISDKSVNLETKETNIKDNYQINANQQNNPPQSKSQDNNIKDRELECTLSVRCDTALQNTKDTDTKKIEILPKDGIIFPEKTVVFYEGESVFDVLLREMKKNKIHMEFKNTPVYNSAYIEGIGNLYEFDFGELSGWMYRVNGIFPNYGCSRYFLNDGDRIEWVYTCDLGKDVGEKNFNGGRQGEQ